MKKSFVALAVLSTFGVTALAQSSVTLYGVMDAGVARVKNGSAGSQTLLQSGAVKTSRFGLRGVEDLGGGLKAGFTLESQINPDVGTAGGATAAPTTALFNRRSTVSLFGGWGELRIGHDYNPSSRNAWLFEPYIGTSFGSILNFTYAQKADLGSGVTTTLRTSNAVAYFTPKDLGGFYGEAMVAPSEGVAGNKYTGARLGYRAGAFDVSAAFGTTKTATSDDFEQSNLGVSYIFSFAKVMGLYNVHKFGALQQKTTAVSISVPVGVGEIRALYGINNRSGGAAGSGFANADDSKQMSVGYVHNLSKRTSLYGIFGRITNDGAAKSTVNYSSPASMRGGESSSGYQMGIVHQF